MSKERGNRKLCYRVTERTMSSAVLYKKNLYKETFFSPPEYRLRIDSSKMCGEVFSHIFCVRSVRRKRVLWCDKKQKKNWIRKGKEIDEMFYFGLLGYLSLADKNLPSGYNFADAEKRIFCTNRSARMQKFACEFSRSACVRHWFKMSPESWWEHCSCLWFQNRCL